MSHLTLFCLTFSVLTNIYGKMFKIIGCIHTSIGCSLIACIQRFSSVINYHITATMDAGIHKAKLNASVGRRQTVASSGCSINFCIQCVSSSCNYCNKAKILQAYIQPDGYRQFSASIGCSIILYIQSN